MFDFLCLMRPIVHFLCGTFLDFYRTVFRELSVTVRKLLSVLQSTQGFASGASQGPHDGHEQDSDNDKEGCAGTWFIDRHVLAVIDKGQVVLAQRVQHQFRSEERRVGKEWGTW